MESLELVKRECAASKNIYILPLDLELHSVFELKVAEAIQAFGKIDMLINNGGISQRSLAEDTGFFCRQAHYGY